MSEESPVNQYAQGENIIQAVQSTINVTHNYYHSPTSATSPAFQVPYPPNPLFVGREAELRTLEQALLNRSHNDIAVLLALSGTGGIGKTQLAAEFAHRYRTHFSGGVFWLDMEDPNSVEGQMAACAGPKGLYLDNYEKLDFKDRVAAVVRAWQEPVARLLVFDNLDDQTLLARWRPTELTSGSRVLVTSRRGAWATTSGVELIPLETLARPASQHLLLASSAGSLEKAAQQLADTTTDQLVDTICERLGDLPLALALASVYLESTSTSLASYLRQLETAIELLKHSSLDDPEVPLPTQYRRGVAAAFAISYNHLNLANTTDVLALTILRRAAYCAPAPIPQSLIVRAVGQNPGDEEALTAYRSAVRRLISLGLIRMSEDKSLEMHRLVAAFVRQRQRLSLRRVLMQQGINAFFLAAARQLAIDTKDNAAIIGDALIGELVTINTEGKPLNGRSYILHAQLAVKQGTNSPQRKRLSLLDNLAQLLYDQGDLTQAEPYLQQAFQLCKQVHGDNHPDTIRLIHRIGKLLQAQGNYPQANLAYAAALALCAKNPSRYLVAKTRLLDSLGELLYAMGDLPKARAILEESLKLKGWFVRDMKDPELIPTTINMGLVLHAMGESGLARTYLYSALFACEEAPETLLAEYARCCDAMAAMYKATFEFDAVRSYYERAVNFNEQVFGFTHPKTAISLTNLGLHLQEMGKLEIARPYLRQALHVNMKILGPRHPETARSLSYLGALLREQGHFLRARICLTRALEIQEHVLGENQETAKTCTTLGKLLQAESNWTEARNAYERALTINTHVFGSNHDNTATSLDDIGYLLQAMDDFNDARSYHEKALAIREAVLAWVHPSVWKSLDNIGTLTCRMGDLEGARAYLERAFEGAAMALSFFNPYSVGCLIKLVWVLEELGDTVAVTPYRERLASLREDSPQPDVFDKATELYRFAFWLDIFGSNRFTTILAYKEAYSLLSQSIDLEWSMNHIKERLLNKHD